MEANQSESSLSSGSGESDGEVDVTTIRDNHSTIPAFFSTPTAKILMGHKRPSIFNSPHTPQDGGMGFNSPHSSSESSGYSSSVNSSISFSEYLIKDKAESIKVSSKSHGFTIDEIMRK